MNFRSSRIDDTEREDAAYWSLRMHEAPLLPADRLRFENWLAGGTERRDLFERTVAAGRALDELGTSPEFLRMRQEALRSLRTVDHNGPTRAGLRSWFAIAACFLLFLTMTGWWMLRPAIYETALGERRVISLPDGSVVSLDSATRIEVDYSRGARRIHLAAGRAKFTVAKNPARPFSVEAGERMIVATGTQFSVEQLSHQLRVVLYEGRVALMDTSHRGAPRLVRAGPHRLAAEELLTPGREVIMADIARDAEIGPVDLGQSSAWESGILRFADEPLGLAVERFNRYNVRKVRMARARDAEIPISGQFRCEDVEAFVEGVTEVFALRARRDPDGGVTLVPKEPGPNVP